MSSTEEAHRITDPAELSTKLEVGDPAGPQIFLRLDRIAAQVNHLLEDERPPVGPEHVTGKVLYKGKNES